MFKNVGGNIPGGNFPGVSLMGGNFPGGSFPDTCQKFIKNTCSFTTFALLKARMLESFNPFKNVSACLLHVYVKCLLI